MIPMNLKQEEDMNFNIKQGSVKENDEFNFPVPGHSLTDEPKKWMWDKPAQFTDPDMAVEFVASKVKEPKVSENFLRLMAAGVSVEQIVNTISLGGFSDGRWNPDVAEIIKPPIAMILVNMAIENKIPVVVFDGNPDEREEADRISPRDTLKVMKEKQPEEFNKIMAMSEHIKNKQPQQLEEEQVVEQEQGFMNMAEPEQNQESTLEGGEVR